MSKIPAASGEKSIASSEWSGLLARIIFFGACAGFAWSLVPGFLTEILLPIGQGATVLVAGIITGVLVSLMLAVPLLKVGWFISACLGPIVLFVGAFIFGVVLYLLQHLMVVVFGTGYHLVVNPHFSPLSSGMSYASYSFVPYLASFLIPGAVFTTLFFRRTLKTSVAVRSQ